VEFSVYTTLTDPPSVLASEASLDPDDLVLGLVLNGQAMAYPIRYLSLYGVVNDRIGGLAIAVTWSSISGSGVVCARSLGGTENVFDYGAALSMNNLLIVDRGTGSVWSQLLREAIAGPMKGTQLKVVPSIQTTWSYWSRIRPDTRVMVPEDVDGQPYWYQVFDPADGYSVAGGTPTHDLADVGLATIIGGKPHFFPLAALAEHVLPVVVVEGSDRFIIVYKEAGLTAWAENAQAMTAASAICYRDSWLAFYPESEIFSTE
jgi:hypothetical protein